MGGEGSIGIRSGGDHSQMLGKYRLLDLLGEGGMAHMYLARCSGPGGFQRHVALKCLLPALSSDPSFVRMFMEEARLAAQLQHQNICQVFDVGFDEGVHYLAMEYLHGRNLRNLLRAREGPLPIHLAVLVAMEVAAALHHAHERVGLDGRALNIVHRDVSPSNVMVTFEGAIKLVDFGIARAAFRVADTRTNELKGKIPYMSPEQAQGQALDRRSDIFSLATVLYEISTGARPFGGARDSDGEILRRIKNGSCVLPSSVRRDYPTELEDIILRAMAVAPDRRYQTAREMYADLDRFARSLPEPPSAMRLEKFMGELFGCPPEPWLGAPRQAEVAGPRQGTITSTGRSDGAPVDPALLETLPILSAQQLAELGFRRPPSVTSTPGRDPLVQTVPLRGGQASAGVRVAEVPAEGSPPAVERSHSSVTLDRPHPGTPRWALVLAVAAVALVVAGMAWLTFLIS